MKKLLSSLFIVALLAFSSEGAMAQVYEKGDKLLNVGVGLGTYGAGGIGLGGSFEYGIHEAISVGALAGYSGKNYFGSRFSVLYLGVRGSYHFNELLNLNNDQIDLYAGAGLGYRNVTWNIDGIGGGFLGKTYGGGIYPLLHIGGKYYLKPNLGLFAELGSGFGTLQAGVAFKF